MVNRSVNKRSGISILKSIQYLLLGKSETELKFHQAIEELNLLSQASYLVNDSPNQLISLVEDAQYLLTGTVMIGQKKVEL